MTYIFFQTAASEEAVVGLQQKQSGPRLGPAEQQKQSGPRLGPAEQEDASFEDLKLKSFT